METEVLEVLPDSTTTVDGQIDDAEDSRLYGFDVPANGRFSIAMDGAGDLDAFLELYNARGRLLRRHDNLSGQDPDSAITFRAREGRTFYVRASGADDTTGTFALSLTSDPFDEHGDTADTAGLLRVNRLGRGGARGRVHYAGDVDLLALAATRTGTMDVTLASLGRRATLSGSLAVTDADGQVLATGAAGDSTVDLAFDVEAGRTYYVRITGDAATTGPYAVLVDTVGPPDVDDATVEPVHVEVDPDATATVEGLITGSTDCGLYSFVVPADGRFILEMDATDGTLDPVLELYDTYGRRRRWNNNRSRANHNSVIRLRARAGTMFYVKAGGDGATTGSYTLRLASDPFDDYGETSATAGRLPVNRRGRGGRRGRVNYGQDVDLMRLTATRTGAMNVTMAAMGRDASLSGKLAICDADANVFTENGGVGASSTELTFNVTAGEVYYVRVSGIDQSVGRYVIRVQTDDRAPAPDPEPTPPSPDDDTEPTPEPIFVPGSEITAEVQDTPDGRQLLVLGTDGSDTIILSEEASALTLTADGRTYTFSEDLAAAVIYTFDGDDVIRTTHTVTIETYVDAGAGDDMLFDAGAASELYGGAGDDLIVTLGGSGSDRVTGGSGFDSYWIDGADTVTDLSAVEAAGGNYHRIAAFYQPYTTDASSPDYVPMTIAGQDLPDPTPTSYANGWQNFADAPLFAGAPTYSDVDQGAVGDCYFLAALTGFAHDDPNIIRQMITPLGDGTYAVRFHRGGREVYLRIDADLPMRYSRLVYADLGAEGETWVALAEKAYAYFRYGDNSYESLSGGWMSTVYTEITNRSSTLRWTSGMTAATMFNYMAGQIDAGATVSLGSYSAAGGPIVGGHAYAVLGTEVVNGARYVTVHNPWGVDGRTYDSNPDDGVLRLTMDTVKSGFMAVAVSFA
ncbi:MAG: C2 family cysteine protease [Planctomycetota bacterium]